ncbi:hypothetical protein H0B56_03540 [Haloechinothrix sp. YIM 98757]|uniref:Uncharacterized protein n=1 Tax=Haloechinothrix aidingensis TaxID=2752311 RepID=A0A838A877_9PSEU|nr:hypothetical protein [Haloechinothrix aidingensis]MBA0124609.1 hypothetical protein [Haloechinothrix aidingensis]
MSEQDEPENESEREAAGLSPRSGARRTPEGGPPVQVRLSFWIWVVASAGLIVGFLLLPARQDAIVAELVEADPGGVSAEDIAAGIPTVLWMFAMAGVAFGVLSLLFAYKMREGTRSARSVLIALTLVMVAFHILPLDPFVNAVTTLAVVLACVAIVLTFLPGAGDYFPKLPRTVRRWRDTP